MHLVDIDFAIIYADKGLLDGALAEPHGLDLRAEELDSRLVKFIEKVVVAGFFVVCNQLARLFTFRHKNLLKMFLQRK